MFRTSLRSVRALRGRPGTVVGGRQWHRATTGAQLDLLPRRRYADSKAPPQSRNPPPTTDSDVGETLAANNRNLLKSSSHPVPSTAPSSSLQPKKKKKGFLRRVRNFLISVTFLAAFGFGGSMLFARMNDNFNDFFTEYVPYAERAMLYLDELDYRRKFPADLSHRSREAHVGEKVRIPAQSGASWRAADSAETGGRQSSAFSKAELAKKKAAELADKVRKEEEDRRAKGDKARAAAGAEAAKMEESKTKDKDKEQRQEQEQKQKTVVLTPPPNADKVKRLDRIDLMALKDAQEPILQDVVHLLNDIIAVINADNAQWKFAGAIGKARDHISSMGSKIQDVKEAVRKEAAAQLHSQVDDIETDIQTLLQRLDTGVKAREKQWREELSAELGTIRNSYEQRVRLLLDREHELHEQKLNGELEAQAISLKREFLAQVRKQVEEEREGRLSKLNELSSAVSSLEQLTAGWNSVVDANLGTQQLHVALEAVRAALHSPIARPFVRELVALKETAGADPVVDAAIASINPSAYQRGVPSAAQLVDRFRRVAAEVRKAALLPEEAGVASHAGSYVLSKVMFRKEAGSKLGARNSSADVPVDVESVLARTQVCLEEGDLDGAAREMNGLTGWAKTLSRDWLGEVRRVLEVRQALDVIATEARLQSLKMDTSQ